MTTVASLSPRLRERYRKLVHGHARSLLWHPQALLNFAGARRELAERPIVMRAQPTTIEIELTNRCNLACIQCLRSRGLKSYELGDVTFDDYRRMLDQFPYAMNICLNGFGEPLLHPQFFDIVAHTRAARPWATMVIYSNGMRLTPDVAQRLPSSGLTEVNVSIDAARPETYRKVRRGGELEVVHENIRGLLRARAEQGSALPFVGVNFVMLNENEGELVRFVEQAAELGVDYVNCITYATYDWGFVNHRSVESYRAELAATKARLSELDLYCRAFPSDDVSWAAPDRAFDCSFFWGGSVRLTFDGHITLGCCTPFKETFSYGNVLATPFSELWNGPTFRKYRELAKRGSAPHPSCESCAAHSRAFFEPREPELVQLRTRAGSEGCTP